MQKGLVSIIIPCFNGSEYIDRCIKSILEQNYNDIEIIIINDGIYRIYVFEYRCHRKYNSIKVNVPVNEMPGTTMGGKRK